MMKAEGILLPNGPTFGRSESLQAILAERGGETNSPGAI